MEEINFERNNINPDNIKELSNGINNEEKQFLNFKKINSNNEYFEDYNTYINNNSIDQNDFSPKLNLSRYKTTKFFGITFYHIGNLYVFGFINNSSEPLFCIDNMWYAHFIIFFIEIILAFTGNYYLFRKLALWKQTIYNILLLSFCIIYNALIFLNPGIVITSQKGYTHTGYCKICNIYFLPENYVSHCFSCNVCVKRLDHHCSVVRKCITKKNFILFIAMIVNFVLLYVYSLVNIVYYVIDFYNKKKKKI